MVFLTALALATAACSSTTNGAANTGGTGGTGSTGNTGTQASVPVVFPPKTLAQAKALAATGDTSQVTVFHSQDNGLVGCFNFGRFIVVPKTLTGQALAATFLKFYFHLEREYPNKYGCGGLSIDAFNSQSQNNPNSASDGEETAGDVQLMIDSKSKYVVDVDLGPATAPTESFSFTY
jgi:hypothetical protein